MLNNKGIKFFVFSINLVFFVSGTIFSEKRKDYANYKDWQVNVEKSGFLKLWEESELNFESFDSVEYQTRIEEITEVF